MSDIDRGIAAAVVRRRWWVLAAWLAVTVALSPAVARVARELDVNARVDGSESARVDSIVRARFKSPFARFAVLVMTGAPSPATREGYSLLERVVGRVQSIGGVTQTLSYLDARDSIFKPSAAGTFVIVGLDPSSQRPDAVVPSLRAATTKIADDLRPRHSAIRLAWTGDIVLNHDIRETSAAEAQRAERTVMPLTLLLLVVAFGAVAASLLPLGVAAVAIVVALGLSVHIARYTTLSILLQNVVTMLGLGLGIDYALLMVSRFREELAVGHSSRDAAILATRAAGHTIVLSAAAVLIGFAALVFIPLNELRAVAIGGGLVVIVAALTAVGPLPGVLAALGPRVNAGRIRRARHPERVAPPSRSDSDAREGSAVPRPAVTNTRWRRWGAFVAAHPGSVLVTSLVPLVALALPLRRIDVSLPRSNWLPPAMESAQGLDALGRIGAGGVVQELRVVVELPPGTSVFSSDGWAAVRRVAASLGGDPRVERVQSIVSVLPIERFDLNALAMVPASVISSLVSADQGAAIMEVVPRATLDFPALTLLARDARRRLSAESAGGVHASVGGLPAFNADYEDAIAGRIVVVVALVVCGTLIALAAGFRSVLVPVKAVVLNLMSVAAALGLVVLVFQDGYGARAFGLARGLGSLFPALPALVFCIVFGLSMDYEVFLVARVREAWRAGLSESDALIDSLARTGRVITSAAAIMVVVFAAFTLGGFVMIQVLGFALAAAVMIDVTIVRVALGPALLRLAGRWNWWPSERPRGLGSGRQEGNSA
jgi:putative drug exporter of the RND superfamily